MSINDAIQMLSNAIAWGNLEYADHAGAWRYGIIEFADQFAPGIWGELIERLAAFILFGV